MAKVLITSVGKGRSSRGYNRANYEIDGKVYEDEKFIASALHKHINFDKVFIVGTSFSIWEAVYEDLGNGSADTSYKILEAQEEKKLDALIPLIQDQLDKNLNTKGSKCYIIKYGVNEDELLENFNYFLDIAKNLNKDDEIYLDITHSFRSLSLMSFVMSEAISNLREKPLNIKSVYYGMFEYSAENDGVTPVVDLKIFFEFLDWSKAIRNFKEYGNSSDLLRLVSDDENLSSFRQNFIYFSNALNMSNMKSIKDALRTKIKPKLSELKEAKNRIYEPIIDGLESFVKWLDVESFALFQYNLAKWYAKNKNYALGYMVLQEAIISAVCEDNSFDIENQSDRDEAKSIIGKWKKDPKNPVYPIYDEVKTIRNSITHAFKCDKRQKDSDAINNLDRYLQQLNKPLFKNRK